MILDRILLSPMLSKEKAIQLFSEELSEARAATPLPHLVYRNGLTFSEQLLARQIAPTILQTTMDELHDLELAGAQLAIRKFLDDMLVGDPLLHHIPTLLSQTRAGLKRYRLTFSRFEVDEHELEEREVLYWSERGALFLRTFKQTEGVHESTEVRLWHLSEIYAAAKKSKSSGWYTNSDHAFCVTSIRHIHHELTQLFIRSNAIGTDPAVVKQMKKRYNNLILLLNRNLNLFFS